MTLIEDLEEVAQAGVLYAAALRAGAGVGLVAKARAEVWDRRAARLREHAKRLREHMEQSDWRVRLVSQAINGGLNATSATQEKQP